MRIQFTKQQQLANRGIFRRCSLFITAFLVLILCSAAVFAQNKKAGLALKNDSQYTIAPDIKNIRDRGYLTVAMVAKDQVPFFFTNQNDEFIGLDVDLAKDIADSLGVDLRFNREAQSFNDLIPIVASGSADLAISKLSRTITRNQVVLFSDAYITFHQALMFNRVRLARIAPTNPEIASFIKRFSGEIGVITNSSYVNYAKQNFPNATVIEYPSWEDVIDAVYRGEVLAAYRDELEIKKAVKGRSGSSLLVKTVLLSDTEDNIAIAISWQSRHLLSWINLFLTTRQKVDADSLLRDYEGISLK